MKRGISILVFDVWIRFHFLNENFCDFHLVEVCCDVKTCVHSKFRDLLLNNEVENSCKELRFLFNQVFHSMFLLNKM